MVGVIKLNVIAAPELTSVKSAKPEPKAEHPAGLSDSQLFYNLTWDGMDRTKCKFRFDFH